MAVNERWKKLIEDELVARNCSVKTYTEWEKNRRREDNWKELLRIECPALSKSISCDSEFFDWLLSLSVFPKRTLETLKQKKGRCAQASAVLDALSRRPFEGFVSFCHSLVKTKQLHVIINILTPESKNTDNGSVTENDAVPVVDVATIKITPFDWRTLVRENLVSLTLAIDPDNGLLRELLSRGVINEWTIDTFQDPKGKSHRAAQIIDHIRQKRPDEDFEKLCDALRCTNQGHVVDRWLTPGGRDRTDLAPDPELSSTVYEQVDEESLRNLMVYGWKDILIKKRNDIIDELDPTDDILNELVKHGVMNIALFEVMKEEIGRCHRADMLIDHMLRRSDLDFARFRMALKTLQQGHVIDQFLSTRDSQNASAMQQHIQQEDTSVKSLGDKESTAFALSDNVKLAVQVNELPDEPSDNKSIMVTSSNNTSHIRSIQQQQQIFQTHGGYDSGFNSGCIEQAVTSSYNTSHIRSVQQQQQITSVGYDLGSISVRIEQDLEKPSEIKEFYVQPCDPTFYDAHKENAYPMFKQRRGKCYIFNIEHVAGMPTRKGTLVDGQNLTELFTQLHFDIFQFKNSTAEEIKEKIRELSRDASLENDQCFVLFIMTHGTTKIVDNKMKDCLFGSDAKSLTTEDVLNPLTDSRCSFLKGKPRLVFFQACRGESYDKTDSVVDSTYSDIDDGDMNYKPDENEKDNVSYRDFLIGYPTQSTYRSFRNTEFGSWYINAFVKICLVHAHRMGLCAMLNTLNGVVSQWVSNTGQGESHKKTQFANYFSNLRKGDLYFFPKIIHD